MFSSHGFSFSVSDSFLYATYQKTDAVLGHGMPLVYDLFIIQKIFCLLFHVTLQLKKFLFPFIFVKM